jgi:DNA polymerase IV
MKAVVIMSRVIMHIDLNAFFCTAEQIRDPSLVGKPMIVGGAGHRGIVSTASYEARALGIHSAMPTYMARQLCPSIIIKHPDFSLYSRLSHELFAFVSRYTKIIEVASIDECFADMTAVLKGHADPELFLKELQNKLLAETGLKCSIGIAPTKFLAKMASDMKKPMGITILRRRDLPSKLYPLPIKDMFGIGKKTYPRLEAIGIKTIGDLAKSDDIEVKNLLGKFYYVLKDWVNGYGSDEIVVEPSDPKSIGNSSTFMNDTNDYDEIKGMFSALAKEVSDRAMKEHRKGTTIQIVIKDADFKVHNRSTTIVEATDDYDVILTQALLLFDKNYQGQNIRLVGVTLQNLHNPADLITQMSLFDYEQHEEESRTKLLINELNRKLKKPMLKRASEAEKAK